MTGRRIMHARPMVPPPLTLAERFWSALKLTVAAIVALVLGFLFVVWFLTLGPA